MPRRPRPLSRAPPKKEATQLPLKESDLPPKKLHGQSVIPSEGNKDEVYDDKTQGSSSDASDSPDKTEFNEEDEEDVDAPRFVQWVDDEEFEEFDTNEEEPGPSKLKMLQDEVSGLPLGALRKAQHVLTQAEVNTNSDESEHESEFDKNPGEPIPKGKQRANPEWRVKHTVKRASKHAPMEVTSKKPVTRRRIVVESKTPQPRDPRFLPIAGELSVKKFQQQYGFLAERHTTELRTLRETLKRARKLLSSSPRDLREEREKEVDRLELAVKRAESQVNLDRRDKMEQETLDKVKKEEREKQRQGKKGWWLKQSEKREVLVKARYDVLAAEGGKRAVKKAIEKRQKKVSQKEKKSRPFPRARPGNGGERSRKHMLEFNSRGDGHVSKKRRVG